MRRAGAILVGAAVLLAVSAPALARPPWKRSIDRITRRRSFSVAVRVGHSFVYTRRADRRRIPASNQKLLTSMALLDRLGPDFRITTSAAARRMRAGVITGDLFVLGRGDPSLSAAGPFARSLSFEPTHLRTLARRIKAAGVRRIKGSVVGARTYFRHDWFAPGWRDDFPALYVAMPAALSFQGNTFHGRHVRDGEARLAATLTSRLRSLGVRVADPPRAGFPRGRLERLAAVDSPPLRVLMRYMNRQSSNFFAEVLGKRLAVEVFGRPGTIAKAARAVRAWCRSRGVRIASHDGSGLSFRNRISARAIVRLLARAERTPWGEVLRSTLAPAGRGTLEDRLRGVKVRAKTGTLDGVSALSGWVWLRHKKRWAQFSILSAGTSKSEATAREDRIVRVVAGARRLGLDPSVRSSKERTHQRPTTTTAAPERSTRSLAPEIVNISSLPQSPQLSPVRLAWWTALWPFL